MASGTGLEGSTMSKILTPPIFILGLLSWLIPFVASFVFFGPSGALWISQPLFKSIMVLVGGASGVWLLWLAFRRLPPTGSTGLAIGALWLVINLLLDALVLLPMSGMGFVPYFMDIGLRYLMLPLIAWAMGAMAEPRRTG
jgi:hypothetical protein